jgi:uncharacterized protein YjdB
VPVTNITGVPTTATVGTPLTLTGTVVPSDATNRTITWSVSNAGTTGATISGNTLSTTAAGTVVVRATIINGLTPTSNYTQDFTITVNDGSGLDLVTDVTLNKNHLMLLVGRSETLIATVLPPTAASKDVVWSCDSPYVATVDQNGLVTGIGAGPALITVKTIDGRFTATCTVLVTVPVSGIVISPAALSIDVGEMYWLTATVEPFNAANTNLTWTSSNTAIATINQAGFVTGVAPGTVTITARAQDGSGITATATVNVIGTYVPVTGVSLNRINWVLTSIGATVQLTPTIIPSNATDQTVTWSSGTPAVASVDSTGLVTAVAPGSAAITVRTTDNGHTAACNIYVQINAATDPSNDIVPEQPTLPPGTPTNLGIVSAEPLIIVPVNSTDISLETDMLEAILPGFSSKDFHVNEYGIITLQDWIAKEIAEARLNIYDSEVVVLPVVEALLNNPGEIAAVSFKVKGYNLMVDNLISRPENVRLMMALSSTSGDFFTYTSVPANFNDKMFTILNASNDIYSGDLNPNDDYKVLFFIKDGGSFDLDCQTDAAVWGVMAFVGVPVLGVTISPDHVPLSIGQSYDLAPGVTFYPPIADNKRLTWTSDILAVANVSAAGVVTAVGGGSALITVKTVDGGFWDTCNIYVSTPVTGITISPATTTINVGGMGFLDATVSPPGATMSTVVWSSSNDAIATVTQAGLVRGVATGTATIRATAMDGSGVFGTSTVTVVP